MTASVDIFAPAAHLAGAAFSDSIDGVDLMAYLTGSQAGAPHDTFFWRQGARTALRKGPWKLVNMNRDLSRPAWALYDIAHDIGETENLASEKPTELQTLVALWKTMNAKMQPPLF